MAVITRGVYFPLKVETRDKYNNLCRMENKMFFKIDIKQVSINYLLEYSAEKQSGLSVLQKGFFFKLKKGLLLIVNVLSVGPLSKRKNKKIK